MASSPRVTRGIARAILIVLIVTASYVVVGREQIPVLGLSVYPDPLAAFAPGVSTGPSGSVIQLDGAPIGAWLQFSEGDVRAYAPTFAASSGVAAIVPPIFRGGTVGSGAVEVRLLSARGPIWTSSTRKTFTVAPPHVTETRLGTPSLFMLQVLHGLLTNASDAASTAVDAGAPAEVKRYASALVQQHREVEALSKQFEMVAWGNTARVAVPGLTLDLDGIQLMDQLAVQFFAIIGGAGASLCGNGIAQSSAGLAATDSEAAIAGAGVLARSLVGCDANELQELAARTNAWLVTVASSSAEALRTARDLSKVGALLEIAMVAWSDEAISATYLLKRYDRDDVLRTFMLSRLAGPGLPGSLASIAAGDPYLSRQLAGIEERRSSAERLIASVLQESRASQEHVASLLTQRTPVLATPSPIPPPPVPIWQIVRLCGTLREHRAPTPSQVGSITIDDEHFSIATDVREDVWSGAREGTKVCMLATVVESPTGRTLIGELTIGAYSAPG